MTRRIGLGVLALMLVTTACSSDPTTSDEYAELEAELAAMTQERDALAMQVATASDERDAPQAQAASAAVTAAGTEVPPGVDQLIDDWWAALEQGDNSVLDLYLRGGYHLYGSTRYSGEDLVNHLAGDYGYTVEWITPTFVAADEGDGTYVAVRGIRIAASSGFSWASAFAFEIETVDDGSLKIAHTAFVYRRD